MKADFVFVDEYIPGIRWDAKYATWDNFTGTPVDGYIANRIVGTKAVCAALEKAQKKPHHAVLACCYGTGIARNVPSIALWSGPNSLKMAGRSQDTIRILPGPKCSRKDTWLQGRATAEAALLT